MDEQTSPAIDEKVRDLRDLFLMDEQTSPAIDPVTPPAGEANTAVPVFEPAKTETPTVEQVMEIPPETPAEPPPAPEITPEIATPEPIPETPTAQTAGNEPLPPQSVEGTPTTEPEPEAPTPTTEMVQQEPESSAVSQGSTAPEPTSVPQGSAQPEPTPVPAQAPRIPETGTGEQVIVTPPRNIARLLLEKAKATIQLRKQKKLLKIMMLFEKKSHITNDEVEKLLHVSDATATRYLSELEKQGRVVQAGKTGKGVTYSKN